MNGYTKVAAIATARGLEEMAQTPPEEAPRAFTQAILVRGAELLRASVRMTDGDDAGKWVSVLEKQLTGMIVAGCTCDTKSPTLTFHDTRCMFRLASECLDTVDEIKDALG